MVHWWSLKQGKNPQWVEVSPEEAAEWLERCGYTQEAARLREA